jgi:predicted nucleic acid-binding Zn ribbon protein
MPLYQWCCKKCNTPVEVIRHFNDYEQPPNASDDLPKDECEHDWERKIGATKTLYGRGWGPNGGSGKGSWIWLGLLIGSQSLGNLVSAYC